jgi:hypothetical protein
MGDKRKTYKILEGKPVGGGYLSDPSPYMGE